MNYVILQKAKPYTRVKRGKLERVKGYTGRPTHPLLRDKWVRKSIIKMNNKFWHSFQDAHMTPENWAYASYIYEALGLKIHEPNTAMFRGDDERVFNPRYKDSRKSVLEEIADYIPEVYKHYETSPDETVQSEFREKYLPLAKEILFSFIRSEYDRTQYELKKTYKGKKSIVLFRGLTDAIPAKGGDAFIQKLMKTKKISVNEIKGFGSLMSLTSDSDVAAYFAGSIAGYNGVVFAIDVPIKNIIASNLTHKIIRRRDPVSGKNEKAFFAISFKGIARQYEVYSEY
jgi:hypothetical protein